MIPANGFWFLYKSIILTGNGLFFSLMLFVGSAIGQDSMYVDSLVSDLEVQRDVDDQIITLRRLAWHHLRYDVDQAYTYTMRFRNLATDAQNDFQFAVSDHYLGLVARLKAEYPTAIEHFRSALEFYQTDTSYRASMTGTLFNLGVVHQLVGNYDLALDYLYQDLEIHQQNNDLRGIANALNSIGITFKNMKDYDRAMQVYDSAYVLALESKDVATQSNLLVNKAIILEHQGAFQEAVRHARLSRALDMADGYRHGVAVSNEMLSRNFAKLERPDSALIYGRATLLMQRASGSRIDLAHAHQAIAEAHLQARMLDQAEIHADSALHLALAHDRSVDIHYAYELLAEIYASQAQYDRAYESKTNAQSWNDSIFAQEKIALAEELAVRYEIEERQKQIKSLEVERSLQEAIIDKQTRTRNLLLVLIALLGSLGYLAYRLRDLKYYTKSLTDKRLQDQQQLKIEQLEREKQNVVYGSMLEGQEKERSRIAKDLHDGLGGLLSTVRVQVDNLASSLGAKMDSGYVETKALVDEACEEVRRISHNMMPSSLSMLGLLPTVEEMGAQLQSIGIKAHLHLHPEAVENVSQMQSVMVYRILQEAVNNVIKHAQARQIWIQLQYADGVFRLGIEDDGIGFDQSQKSAGIGLANLEARAQYLAGTLLVESKPQGGTSITLAFPKQAPEQVL
ncbi:MAG: tetratricopeptide repeat protein [Saprospiraceae bacterium]|nr:tetratricopeptide repeat protein [Saprospiraceae bacterium]